MSVADAPAAGFPTFVVGISAPARRGERRAQQHGGRGRLPARGHSPSYYPVTSAAEFATVLRTLVTIAGTCTFPVPEPPNNDTDRAHIGVKVNGTEISGTRTT